MRKKYKTIKTRKKYKSTKRTLFNKRGLFRTIKLKTKQRLRQTPLPKCWFYISIHLHARKLYDIISKDVFCVIRCCPNDQENRGSLSEHELEHISSIIYDKTDDEIKNMTLEDIDESTMSNVFQSIENGEELKQIFTFTDETCPVFKPWCGNIVNKFMGLNKDEEISIESDENDKKLSGFQLLGLSNNIKKYNAHITHVLDNINKSVLEINTNEYGCEENGIYLSDALKTIKTDIVNLLTLNFRPIVFVLDITCNGNLKEREHCELASKNAYGGN